MKTRMLSTLVLLGLTNLAIAGATPVQQEEKPQAAPTQQSPVQQQAPAPTQQQSPAQQAQAPTQQTAPAAQQQPAAQQAAPSQAAPRLTARERRAQRRARRIASGRWTRIVRPAVQ